MFGVLFERGFDGRTYLEWLLSGLGWTLALAVFGWCFAFAIGVTVGIGRTVRSRFVRAAARFYVEA